MIDELPLLAMLGPSTELGVEIRGAAELRHKESDRIASTAAALRAMEIKADIILKGTRVDGIYSADPEKHPDAEFFEHITYMQVLEKGLKVMDTTAISLCLDNSLPMIVFDIKQRGNMKRVVTGERIGTRVDGIAGGE